MLWLLALLPMGAGLLAGLLASLFPGRLALPSFGSLAALSPALARRMARRSQAPQQTDFRTRVGLAAVAVMALLGTLLVALIAIAEGWTAHLPWGQWLQLNAALAPLSAVVAVTVIVVALPVLVFACFHQSIDGLHRLIGLLLLFVGAMELLVIADDLLLLLIGWEAVGACSWALISQHWRDPQAPRSAAYAFLMTRAADLGLFVAAIAALTAGGSLTFGNLANLPRPALDLVAGGLIVAAAAKSGQLPFSPWLFRAMAGPTSVSALLHAATMVTAGAYILARLQPQLSVLPWFAPVVMAIGLTTALGAGVVALLQPHAKKLLAASTSAHFGMMFAAIAGGYPAVAIAHLVAHAFFKAQLFCCAGIAGKAADGYGLSTMQLGRRLPLVAVSSLIAASAMAGLPLFGAAWTKEAMVAAAGAMSHWAAFGVVAAGALSAACAARFQLLAFGLSPNADESPVGPSPSDPAPLPPDPRRRSRRQSARLLKLAIGALALATLLLSVLWLPDVHTLISTSMRLPLIEPSSWQGTAAIVGAVFGVLAGRWLVLQRRQLGEDGVAARLSDWFGLPRLIERAVIAPMAVVVAVCDRVDGVIDQLPTRLSRMFVTGARQLSRIDRAWVDRSVRAAATMTRSLAGFGNRFGEWLADGLPQFSASLVSQSARDAARLHTGLSHHQFAFVAIGAVLLTALLIAAH